MKNGHNPPPPPPIQALRPRRPTIYPSADPRPVELPTRDDWLDDQPTPTGAHPSPGPYDPAVRTAAEQLRIAAGQFQATLAANSRLARENEVFRLKNRKARIHDILLIGLGVTGTVTLITFAMVAKMFFGAR